MSKQAPDFCHHFLLPLRAAGIHLQMASLLQEHAVGWCFNQTAVGKKKSILVCNPGVCRLSPELLSCATYLWHPAVNSAVLLDSWIIAKIRSSLGLCKGVSDPDFASSHAVLDRKKYILRLQGDFSLSVQDPNCCFEITFPVLGMLIWGRKK